MVAVWNHQLRPDAPLALLLTGENIPTLIGLSATHPTNLTILGQPRRRPKGAASSGETLSLTLPVRVTGEGESM
jgi:hypothetical protein